MHTEKEISSVKKTKNNRCSLSQNSNLHTPLAADTSSVQYQDWPHGLGLGGYLNKALVRRSNTWMMPLVWVFSEGIISPCQTLGLLHDGEDVRGRSARKIVVNVTTNLEFVLQPVSRARNPAAPVYIRVSGNEGWSSCCCPYLLVPHFLTRVQIRRGCGGRGVGGLWGCTQQTTLT